MAAGNLSSSPLDQRRVARKALGRVRIASEGRRVRRSFNQSTLAALRELPSEEALARLAIFVKADETYRPAKQAAASRRWQVRTAYADLCAQQVKLVALIEHFYLAH